jgi:AAA family ATP:ADP antiporter
VRDLLTHPAAEVRAKAVSILNAAGDTTVASQMEALLHDKDLLVRTEALLYLAMHANIDPLMFIQELGDFSDFSVCSAVISYLARSGEPDNIDAAREILNNMVREQGPVGDRTRQEAAHLLGSFPTLFESQLVTLIQDRNPDVARQAIGATGSTASPAVMHAVLDRLGDPELSAKAAEALAGYGDAGVDILAKCLADDACPMEIKREIPGVLVHMGNTTAAQILMQSLLTGDTELRSQIIIALTDLQDGDPDLALNTEVIETVLVAEIIGHYRSCQIQETLEQAVDQGDTVLKAVRQSMQQDLERIFQLIKLLYPHHDLRSVHFGIRSDRQEVRDNALEFLENILKPELRNLLVPLLDPHVSSAQRVRLINGLVGTSIETSTEALLTLLAQPEPWLKSCAIYSIGILGLTSLRPELDVYLTHPDPLLRETARQAKRRLAERPGREK